MHERVRGVMAGSLAKGPSTEIEPTPARTAVPGKHADQSAENVLQAMPLGSVTLHGRTGGAAHRNTIGRLMTRCRVAYHASLPSLS